MKGAATKELRVVLPTPELWPEGIDELEAFEYSVTDAGNVRSGAPSGRCSWVSWSTIKFVARCL